MIVSQPLSKREAQVLIFRSEGYGNRQIGEKLGISPKTVTSNATRGLQKFEGRFEEMSSPARMQLLFNLSSEEITITALPELSQREVDVLQLLVRGKNVLQIAKALFRSSGAIGSRIERIQKKLNVFSIPLPINHRGLICLARDVLTARKLGLIDLPQLKPKKLSMRQAQVLTLKAEGNSNEHIAQMLGVSPKTIATHLTRGLEKTGEESVHSARKQSKALASNLAPVA